MAENIEFLADALYPEEKIVVWAHNAHICHDRQAMPGWPANSMGKWIVESHRPELYTIGLFMYRGKAAWNTREIYDVTPAVSGSVESIFYRTRRKYCFLDMLGRERNDGNSWMFETVTAKSWGRTDWPLVPRDQYDAILFIDTVDPPRYIEGSHLHDNLLRPLRPAAEP
jgi:erythromycin esterase